MGFKNRVDAGRELAQALAKYKDKRPAILALPRGGVPVAVAAALDAPLDLILVRKIGVPMQHGRGCRRRHTDCDRQRRRYSPGRD